MLKRPRPSDKESDILQMQEEYLQEKYRNTNHKPAAQVINLRSSLSESQSKVNYNEAYNHKPSKYAQSKGLKSCTEKRARIVNESSVMGGILEKNVEEDTGPKEPILDDDKVYYPQVQGSVLGSIIEKNTDDFQDSYISMPTKGFPDVTKFDPNMKTRKNLKNIFEKNGTKMDVDEDKSIQISEYKVTKINNLPSKSFILSSKDADSIHTENINYLNKMSEKEILDEQKKLLCNLDPKLIDFIKSKRKQAMTSISSVSQEQDTKILSHSIISSEEMTDDSLWENDVLLHPHIDKWLHFNCLEKDKLAWMKDIQDCKKLTNDEPYEARFDFNGYLLPYSIEYTEKTKTLFHHGEEQHRPGYSIAELFELSRSTILQQRVLALNIIAGILEYYNVGTYKDIIDLPLSKIFFLIRIALDENKPLILDPALKAMRNLICNRIDEACLDALIGFVEGIQQPCLENDKSEITQLESEESEFKDFHLAEIDIITALVRTDILQRMYYILEYVKPSFNCIQFIMQILTRLVRDSEDLATKIINAEHLMKTIMNYFIPVSSINFVFEPQIVYSGKPILAAIKFIRILSLQSADIAYILTSKYNILMPISEYISSTVDGIYGLHIQIEAICVISNLLQYNIGVETATVLYPIMVTNLYKHVQGTDVFLESSIISAKHGAVILQFFNKLFNCHLSNFENYKNQVYALLKEGVQKWITQLSKLDSYTCGHLSLVSSALDCCRNIIVMENIQMEFLNDLFQLLLSSNVFQQFSINLSSCSNLLSGIENKDLHFTKNLKSIGGSVIGSTQKILPLLNIISPIPFLASIFRVLEVLKDKSTNNVFVEKLSLYLRNLEQKAPSLCDNWFTRIEADLIFSILKVSTDNSITEPQTDLLYKIANKLCFILRMDKINEIEFLFNNIVFNKRWFTAERLLNIMSVSDSNMFPKALFSVEDIKFCYSQVIGFKNKNVETSLQLKNWQEPILPRDWIYLPILNLYSKCHEIKESPKVAELISSDKKLLIKCSLEWIWFNEKCFPDMLEDIDLTDRFCRILCVFLCDNSLFLDQEIKELLHLCIQELFKKEKTKPFDFNKPLTGLHNFQDFYMQLLEQFQSVSYGDYTFAACILVPLAQKHNVQWRKILWSEYAGCLRALDCPKERLCYSFNDYLYPEENDESLIKSYCRALSSNLLRPDTIAYKIAAHHVFEYKKRLNHVPQ